MQTLQSLFSGNGRRFLFPLPIITRNLRRQRLRPARVLALLAASMALTISPGAHAQITSPITGVADRVGPTFVQYTGEGGAYGTVITGYDAAAPQGVSNLCATDSPENYTDPQGSGTQSAFGCTTLASSAAIGSHDFFSDVENLSVSGEDDAPVLYGYPPIPWAMSGETSGFFIGNYIGGGGIDVDANVGAVDANNGGIASVAMTAYEENIDAEVLAQPPFGLFVLNGDELEALFNVEGQQSPATALPGGFGSNATVSVCLWSAGRSSCQQWSPDSTTFTSAKIPLSITLGPSRRVTVVFSAFILNETPNSDAFIRIHSFQAALKLLNWRPDAVPAGAINPVARFINEHRDQVGLYQVSNGATEGFEDTPSSSPLTIVDPNDNAGYTGAYGINDSGKIVGVFNETSEGVTYYHGFLLDDGSYTSYDVGSGGSTTIYGINDNGDFVGSFGPTSSPYSEGFVQPASGGPPVTFSIPGVTALAAEGVNDSDSAVGAWLDANGNYHGFLQEINKSSGGEYSVGNLTTFDFPGAVDTIPTSITDNGNISGQFIDSSGDYHAFFGPLGGFTQYDLEGVAQTASVGLNAEGVVAGTYQAEAGGAWGAFTAQLCMPNVSSSVKVTEGALTLNTTTKEWTQQIAVKNTSADAIAGPIVILFGDLPQGVALDNGDVCSSCSAPGTPLLIVTPSGSSLNAGQTATVTANFANFGTNSITYTPTVEAGPEIP